MEKIPSGAIWKQYMLLQVSWYQVSSMLLSSLKAQAVLHFCRIIALKKNCGIHCFQTKNTLHIKTWSGTEEKSVTQLQWYNLRNIWHPFLEKCMASKILFYNWKQPHECFLLYGCIEENLVADLSIAVADELMNESGPQALAYPPRSFSFFPLTRILFLFHIWNKQAG